MIAPAMHVTDLPWYMTDNSALSMHNAAGGRVVKEQFQLIAGIQIGIGLLLVILGGSRYDAKRCRRFHSFPHRRFICMQSAGQLLHSWQEAHQSDRALRVGLLAFGSLGPRWAVHPQVAILRFCSILQSPAHGETVNSMLQRY